jgi:hypothetical protein
VRAAWPYLYIWARGGHGYPRCVRLKLHRIGRTKVIHLFPCGISQSVSMAQGYNAVNSEITPARLT